jgi:hypothetical protein
VGQIALEQGQPTVGCWPIRVRDMLKRARLDSAQFHQRSYFMVRENFQPINNFIFPVLYLLFFLMFK